MSVALLPLPSPENTPGQFLLHTTESPQHVQSAQSIFVFSYFQVAVEVNDRKIDLTVDNSFVCESD